MKIGNFLLVVSAMLVLVSEEQLYVGGLNVVIREGDMLVPYMRGRHAITSESANPSLWPDGIIPFMIDTRVFSSREITMIKAAISEFTEKTCVKWKPHDFEQSYAKFTRVGSGCYSWIGQARKNRSQMINVSPNCFTHGEILHEMMHTLGFLHEHTRNDRDSWIRILPDNIREGAEIQFNKKSPAYVQLLDLPYDYNSIMHFSAYEFSKNGRPTIEALRPLNGSTLGQRRGLSSLDIRKVNKLYNCNPPTTLKSIPTFPVYSQTMQFVTGTKSSS